MILCIFTMLIACGVFGYSLNSIGMILMDFNSREKEIKDNLFTINNYMDQKNVNQDLQYKIRQYLDFYWREMKNSNIEKEEKIISQLSDLLRDELLLEANKFILKESPIFSSNFTDFMIMRTVKLIHEYRCAPKEVICFEDQQDDCSIYFIQKGEVDIIIDSIESLENNSTSSASSQNKAFQSKTKVLQSLKKGDHFGGVSFFTGQPRRYSICSKEFTTLLMIKRQDFIELLTKESPEDYEMFCAIKDSILNYNNYSQLNIQCFACQSESHLMGECPLIHFIANKQFLIRKLQFSPPQDSLRTYLRKKLKFKTLLKLNFVQKRIAKFCDFDEKEGERLLDQYEQEYGIESMSSESSRQSSSDCEPSNNRMNKSMASEKSERVSVTSINKRNSQKLQNGIYNDQKSQDEISDNSQNVLQVNDQNHNFIYSQKFNTNQFKSGGSSGKISQKNPSSENVLEESDYNKVKIGEHLLYGSDAYLQNTNTQLGKSFKNFEDKGNLSYQKSSSFHSKYQSKMNTLYQLSIGSSGSQNQFMGLGINDLSEQLLNENKNSYKTKSIARNSTHSKSMHGSNKNEYDALNNEMRYIDDGILNQNVSIQYQMISEKLGKQILDIQLNQQLSEDQKFNQINAINSILENLKFNNNSEPDRIGTQIFKINETRKQSLTSSQIKYNVKKVESLFNYLFSEKKDNSQEKSQQQMKDQRLKDQEELQLKQQRRNTKKNMQNDLVENNQKVKKSQIDLEFESKKSFYQYFPHNNCERVILIANMTQIERRKKLNKIVISKKMNKVERKQNKKNTRMIGNQSKFNKLLNSFQNQTEQDEEDIKDCMSTKRKQSYGYKRKQSQFAQQQNDTKLEKSQESYFSQQYNNDKNQQIINDEHIEGSELNCVLAESKQYSFKTNNQEGQAEKNCEDQSNNQIDFHSDCEKNQQQSPFSDDSKKENSKKFEFVLDEQIENKQYETKQQSNLLQFQRTMGKKKLSEIPENECPSSYIETNSQLMLNSKHLIHNSIQRGFTDSSQEQQLAGNSMFQSRQESQNGQFGSKRPSYFLNQEIFNIQQNQGHSHESIDKASSKTLQKPSLNNIDIGHKSLLFDNIDQWYIGHSKDDCINPIFNMNIDLNEVKKYHKWDQNDFKIKYI
ncbi:cation channel family protein (macronuclear) [Tetrahymena thermophila SB210]|uniref:Cation channel family protein n=1 Tax=Tetrahymena thermophila (strain SB210) TaxID=312017 RepID=I7MB05_TETTS|nr:cation channel family protein [Tetrahymena thermophila SB210]EAS07059.2 cation channel family protein [Tetrahymena thermophila SB210]|eukprot:XP_001027301.2 cation channel family protein [Tetrahymena thermophila SB210]